MNEPVALSKPHENASNILSIEGLVASQAAGPKGTLTSTSFYIYTLDGKSRRTAWRQSSSN